MTSNLVIEGNPTEGSAHQNIFNITTNATGSGRILYVVVDAA